MVCPSLSIFIWVGESGTPPMDFSLNTWFFGKMNSNPLRSALYWSVASNSFPALEIIPSTLTGCPSFSSLISSSVSLTPLTSCGM